MKKLLLIAAIAFLAFTTSQAQVSFGAKAGLNLASLVGDGTDDLKMKTSFHVGAVAEISITEDFKFAPELLYSSQGAKADSEDVDVTLNLDYINLPLMVKYQVADGFTLEAGPQVGFLISSKAKADGDSVDLDGFSSIDFGLNLGLGYKLESGLFFQGRYNIGLSNVWDFDGAPKTQNGVIQVSVGYFFN